MSEKPATVKEYLDSLPEDRRAAIAAVRDAVNQGLPRGYEEGIQYGMIGWYVPHDLYPSGYHCDPKQGVPFAALASQKNYMALYLTCVYGSETHREQFERDWAKSGKKLDMGKSCVRFKRLEDVPLDVVTAAIGRVPVDAFLAHYEGVLSQTSRGPATKKTSGKAVSAKTPVKTSTKKTAAKTVTKAAVAMSAAAKKTAKTAATKTVTKAAVARPAPAKKAAKTTVTKTVTKKTAAKKTVRRPSASKATTTNRRG